MTITELDKKIKVLEKALRDLRKEREEQEKKEQDAQKADAYKNALDAMFDGIKFVADINNPFVLNLPMLIIPNMYYTYNEKLYVGIKKEIATAENLSDVLEAWEVE